jgi:hypothetical protein
MDATTACVESVGISDDRTRVPQIMRLLIAGAFSRLAVSACKGTNRGFTFPRIRAAESLSVEAVRPQNERLVFGYHWGAGL